MSLTYVLNTYAYIYIYTLYSKKAHLTYDFKNLISKQFLKNRAYINIILVNIVIHFLKFLYVIQVTICSLFYILSCIIFVIFKLLF